MFIFITAIRWLILLLSALHTKHWSKPLLFIIPQFLIVSSMKQETQDTRAWNHILRISILDLVSACRDCWRPWWLWPSTSAIGFLWCCSWSCWLLISAAFKIPLRQNAQALTRIKSKQIRNIFYNSTTLSCIWRRSNVDVLIASSAYAFTCGSPAPSIKNVIFFIFILKFLLEVKFDCTICLFQIR